MEHLEARREMAQKLGPELGRLRRLNTGKRAFEVAFFGGLLLSAWSWAPRSLALLAAAVALNAFLLLLHEGMHGLLARSPRLNRWLSVCLGGFLLISHSAYQVMHERHHRYLGDPRDPDDYDNYFKSRRVVWLMHYVRLIGGSFFYLALIPYLSMKHGTAEQRRRIAGEYLVLGTAYAALWQFANHAWLLEFWILPLVAVGLFTNLRGLSQHGIADAHDPYLASRSIHLPKPLAFLVLYENYHLEHHLFPEVPSYHLPELHEKMYANLPRAVVNRSYGEFLWSFLKATPSQDRSPIGLVRKCD